MFHTFLSGPVGVLTMKTDAAVTRLSVNLSVMTPFVLQMSLLSQFVHSRHAAPLLLDEPTEAAE